MESGVLLLCSRGPVTELCPETDESSTNPHTLFVTDFIFVQKEGKFMAGPLNRLCGVGNFGNVLFGLHAGNMKFDTQNEE
jgi:hypothetical protein